jgi:drug/metabolite transporter (DMT)-like permease
LTYLPLPDATVLTFLAPTVVGYACSIIPSLREPFTIAEKFGGLVSLFGVVLIARPEFIFAAFRALSLVSSPPSALGTAPPAATPSQRFMAACVGMTGVLGAATAYTTIRWIGTRAHPLISVTYFSTLTTIASFFLLILVPSTGGFIRPTGSLEWTLLGGIGACGFIMQFLLTKGLQMVKAGKAGMMVYTQMVFALLFEWLVWGNTPDLLSVVGGGMIFGSAAFVNFWKGRNKIVTENKAKTVDEESALFGDDVVDDTATEIRR